MRVTIFNKKEQLYVTFGSQLKLALDFFFILSEKRWHKFQLPAYLVIVSNDNGIQMEFQNWTH